VSEAVPTARWPLHPWAEFFFKCFGRLPCESKNVSFQIRTQGKVLVLPRLFSPGPSPLYQSDRLVCLSFFPSLFCLLISPLFAVAAGESRRHRSAVSQRVGVNKSAGRAADKKSTRAEGRKLKRGQGLRERGQQ